ncbi:MULTISPECIES: PH domain-containing protein [unclassified Gordonia (in: high G+C Gram-positive bacteria)]
MDNSAAPAPESWSTPRAYGIVLAVAGAVLLVAAIAGRSEPAGTIIMGVAGLLALGLGVYTLTIRPRLALGPGAQVTVRTIGGTQTYPVDRVEHVELRNLRRINRRSGQLQLEVLPDGAPPANQGGPLRDDTRLIVFSRWDLGADLEDVGDALRRAGFVVDDKR